MRKIVWWRGGWITLLLALMASAAHAQTTYNPSTIIFDSVDHLVACPAVNCVSGYKVEYWLQNVDPLTGAPVSVYTLDRTKVTPHSVTGEPAWQAKLADLTPLPAVPVGQTYVARMIAVGDGGTLVSGRSDASNPFVFPVAPHSTTRVLIK